MPENTKNKKIRLYKFASEYNLSSESLMEFLTSKGHKVKSLMTILTDEMLADIYSKYKKDIEKAEIHYRKVNEFHKKRIERFGGSKEEAQIQEETQQLPKEEVVVEAEEKPEVESEESSFESNSHEEVVEQKEEVVATEESFQEPAEQGKLPEVKIKKEPEAEKPEVTDVAETTIEEPTAKEEPKEEIKDKELNEQAVKIEDEKPFKTKTEIEMEKNNKGLTIVGKIDLDKPKRSKRKNRKENKDEEKPVVEKTKVVEESAEEKAAKKKRKKKKTKSESEIPDDETPKWSKKSKKSKKKRKIEVDETAVEEAIRQTMFNMDSGSSIDRASFRKKKRKEKAEHEEQLLEQKELEQKKLKVTEFIAVSELANMMGVNVADVITKFMELGLMVSINQRLDVETITLVADEFGYEVEFQEEYVAEIEEDEVDSEENLEPRSPVVTIMGHVDHGKTSLLDYIRRENVVAGEAGGITQHIGAYKVQIEDKEIAFLDTPGHEAFTAMRARGASVTDIVVLIVAADDAVMPQTVEAINHALAAEVPIIVAINKIDKPGANPDKIRQQLADRNILVEDWGGKYQCVEISAKQGLNIDLLLEKILLEAEMLELKANPNRRAKGAVIESQLDKGRGITATILVQNGTLRIGDPFVAGIHHGRVRAMFDERNNKVEAAGPSTPVLVLGFEGAPQAGDTFVVMKSEREARELAIKRQQLKREQEQRQHHLITLDEIAAQAGTGGLKELPLIVKGDVDGSVEALADAFMKLTNDEVTVHVIHKGVGAISESDVILAAASNAIIIGFHVRPHNNARKLAEKEKVDIRLYNVIYDAINEVKSALEGLLSPEVSEKMVATVEVRDTFKVPKVGTVAGCYVQDGKIKRNHKIRLFRDGIVIYEGELSQLKRFKDDVREVDAGYECGLNINNFNDVKVGDIIEAYEIVETKKKLEL